MKTTINKIIDKNLYKKINMAFHLVSFANGANFKLCYLHPCQKCFNIEYTVKLSNFNILNFLLKTNLEWFG